MLTARQARFVAEYLVDSNATKAAARAGYSSKTANEQGARLLVNVSVADAISKARARVSEKLEITQERVLREYAKIAFGDIRKVVKWGESVAVASDDGEVTVRNTLAVLASTDIDDDTAAAVEEVSEGRQGLKIKMHDKQRALDSLARHLGLFEKDNAQKAPIVMLNVNDADIL